MDHSERSSFLDRYDLICLSHLRWRFVFQRPQHLMTRCARERRVFFFEEPLFDAPDDAWLELQRDRGVLVATPHLPAQTSAPDATAMQRALLDGLLEDQHIASYVLWYYTPMALAFSDHLAPRAVIYDCMDELSAFANAPAALKSAEAALLRRADVVFTGGQSLYEAKRDAHANVHAFPSSVEVAHFAQARLAAPEPDDQRLLPRPRLGFFGVIDERMDLALIERVALARQDWQLVMLGPVVKIDAAMLPRLGNIHYLGSKTYEELPLYIAGWDVALLPFALNDATRFISPTKTPEYMAAGKPVVSTPIRDVVRPYGERGLVRIAATADDFIAACDAALVEAAAPRLRDADAFLRQTSWDGTWARMRHLVDSAQTANVAGAAAAAQ
jgi:hypothetical protein